MIFELYYFVLINRVWNVGVIPSMRILVTNCCRGLHGGWSLAALVSHKNGCERSCGRSRPKFIIQVVAIR